MEEQLIIFESAMSQKWLRDIHSISVNITHRPHSQTYGFNITGKYNEGNQGVLKSYDFKSYETYEEALEQGLTEALNLIQK